MSAGLPDPKEIEELLLGGELRYTRGDAVRLSGVSRGFSSRLWRAFGYPSMPDEAVAYTEGDVAALCRIRRLMDDGVLDEDGVIRLVRAFGQTMTRLAEWQVNLLSNMITAGPEDAPTPEAVRLIVEIAEKHIGEFEPLVVHAWRRQLAAAGTRALASAATRGGAAPGRAVTTVGFADMVSFTQMSREVEELELARVVEWFEETAADIIASCGGRLVKTLGDEVLFCAEDPRIGAEIALTIAEQIKDETEIPDVRVGMAYGPVLPLMGDVFGTTVNLAARLTSLARPGAVMVDGELAARLEGDPDLDITTIVKRPVRGLGIVQPSVLRRATGAAPPAEGWGRGAVPPD
ncbi:adenylate/guanylate cyclase domain-containing protein [Actinomadura parmotrematis]|uniref:Adenylate/guanylate cyclase domain-containing protein n=1 Tax=Actinomadura parmotrematis TaxID=2864039 RepID=A0ABS7FZ20_9ACTN|nr:adenylate/guanylate cyclase domain-containing protein [Actinomadura parmotrematis]MBW8484688.1 adenylate/guanylate cyclase domain-containing protein [Actinomadura parmotrematis]